MNQLQENLEETLKAKQDVVASHQAMVDTLAGVIARQVPTFVHVKPRQRSHN